MTTETIKDTHQLNAAAISIADTIIEDARHYGGADWLNDFQSNYDELSWQACDGSEYVIYYHHAKAICCNCDISQGEDRVLGLSTFADFNTLCTQIAFWELHTRVIQVIECRLTDLEETADEVAA